MLKFEMPRHRRAVQSCIAHVSFPRSFHEFPGMFRANAGFDGRWPIDIATLLSHDGVQDYWWSAPRWLAGSDIMWMYFTRSGSDAVRRLHAEFRRDPRAAADAAEVDVPALADLLAYVAELTKPLHRSIFACVEIADGAAKFEDAPEGKHHSGRMYAPLGRIHVLEHPIALETFSGVVKLATGGAYTAVTAGEYDALRNLVATENELPSFVVNTCGGDQGFRHVSRANWWEMICRPGIRFLHEKQVRAYFIDHLLDSLRDRGTPLLQEFACQRHGHTTGYADYLIRIAGRWTPVEAKFDVEHERDVPGQLAKYLEIDSGYATTGDNTGQMVSGPWADRVLVVDRHGIYIADISGFVRGDAGSPAWKRERLTSDDLSAIRTELRR